ncbi:MAG: hypothetical protein N4A35_06645 [Flavobacteriales bacterium]|jgi:hypothetical protein|nr:hypothetical protein [Flavobacteriales bacterium]
MQYNLTKSKELSGDEASIYLVNTINKNEEEICLFTNFIEQNIDNFKFEIEDILIRLKTIGTVTGAREQFFKTKEGFPGDFVCALYDNPNSNLRLYCIRYGKNLIVVGGGGPKPKSIRALQESEILTKENYLLRELSNKIEEYRRDGLLCFTEDYYDFEGCLTIE